MGCGLCGRSVLYFLKICILCQRTRKKSKFSIQFHGLSQIKTVRWKKIQASTAFNGGAKLAKKDRLARIQKIQDEFSGQLTSEELAFVTYSLEEIL